MRKIVLLISVLTLGFLLSGCDLLNSNPVDDECEEGYSLVEEECVLDSVCEADEELIDGECVEAVCDDASCVQNEAPVLSGVVDLFIVQGQDYDLMAGISATDTEDGDITEDIIIDGTVDSATVGEYMLTYSVTDSADETTSVVRTVNVTEYVPNCLPGYYAENGVCIKEAPVCEDDEIIIDGQCAKETLDSCPPGYELLSGYCFELNHPEYNDLGYEEYTGRDIVSDSCSHLDNIGEWQPVWCDEFDYEGLPNSGLWYFETGGHGWGNGESQFYTASDLDNARVEDGNLIITAVKEEYNSSDYTSVRLNSKSGNWTYGKIQVRAILPSGRGTWPAIWMLSTDWEYGGWPESGEIDIMEYVGYDPNVIHATVHTKAYYHSIGTQVGKSKTIVNPEKLYHVYEIEWEPGVIKAYVDGIKYFTYEFDPEDNIDIETFKAWPFDKDFHLILNIAIGGAWGGLQGIDETIFPTSMMVDYVRVYQKDYEGMDQSAPEAVTNLEALSTKQTTVYLGWDVAVDDVMIEYYELYVDDVLYASPTVNGFLVDGLTPGTQYDFKVKAFDFAGNVSEVTTITTSTSTPSTSLERIEAEDYSAVSGLQTEPTSDVGGGENIGWTDAGDYLEYVVDVLEAGTYTITFRVAGDGSASGMDVLSDGTFLVNTAVPGTGGWQSWTDVTTTSFTLSQGIQTIRLNMVGSGFNINYFELNKVN